MDKHSTSMDNGTVTMNKTSSLQRNVAVQARIINKLLDRSQIYMDSAFRLIHQSSAHIIIVFRLSSIGVHVDGAVYKRKQFDFSSSFTILG